MSVYYPQAGATVSIIWENYGEDGNAILQKPYTFAVRPKRFSVDLNSYSQADTFEMDLDYKCFPFDPRMIRSMQVSLHLDSTNRHIDALGNVSQIQMRTPTPGEQLQNFAASLGLQKSNAVIMGFVDEESITLNDTTRTVSVKGRDYTALFIDSPWPGNLINKSSGDVALILTLIKNQLPATRDIQVENRTGDPILPIISKNAFDFGRLSAKDNPRKNDSYWDVIQRVLSEAALIGYIELDKLVISKPSVFYKGESRTSNFFYGENITSLEMNRKIGRMKNFNVRIKAWSTKDKSIITADIPRESINLPQRGADITVEKLTIQGGASVKKESPAPFIQQILSNVADKNALIRKGEEVFEEIGRQQIEGTISTREMCVFNANDSGEGECIKIAELRAGKSIRVEVKSDDLKVLEKGAKDSAKIAHLISRGWQEAVAVAYTLSYSKFSTPFYVRSSKLNFDIDSGFSCSIDFVNRIDTKRPLDVI